MHPETHTHTHKRSMWAASPALWNILHPTCLYNSLSTSSSWSLITLSLYPPLRRKSTPPLLSLSLKSAGRAPSAIEHDFVTLGASKERITPMRSGCSKSHLCWRFYVGKNWITNLHYWWQHRSWEVKSCYHPVLLIFAGVNSIEGKWLQTVYLLFITAHFKPQTLARRRAVMTRSKTEGGKKRKVMI